MEEKKNNKGLIWLIVILIILVLGLIGYIVYDKTIKDDNQLLNNNTTTTTTSNKDNEESTKSKEDLLLYFENNENPDGTKRNYYDVVGNIGAFSSTQNIKDVVINDIKLEGKSHLIKIKNFNPDDSYDCVKGKDKVLYFDEQILHEPENEACYLSSLSNLVVLNEKYLVVHYSVQNGGFMIIVDKNGNKISMPNDIIVSSINFVNNNTIYFEGWENDEECYSNLYKLSIVDNKVQINLIDKSTNMLCF